jgi:hypothetical protein
MEIIVTALQVKDVAHALDLTCLPTPSGGLDYREFGRGMHAFEDLSLEVPVNIVEELVRYANLVTRL